MTTVVVDSHVGFKAADRRSTANGTDVVMDNTDKIKQVDLSDGIHLIGFSGNEGPAQIFLNWYEFGDEYECLDPVELDDEADYGFEAVILTPDGTILVADRFMNPYEVENRFYCTGTGGAFAWGVLQAGCGIDKAMEAAIALDANSGGGYDVVYLSEVNK